MENSTAKVVLSEFDQLKNDRYGYHQDWRDITSLVRPNTTDFDTRAVTKGESRTLDAYDGTARNALSDMASGLQSFLTNPQDRWFSLGLEGVTAEEIDHDTSVWLDRVTTLLYSVYSDPKSNHQHSIQECYLDLGSLGTGSVNQEMRNGTIVFRADDLASYCVRESVDGLIDTKFTESVMTARQLRQRFGDSGITSSMNEKIRDGKESHRFGIVHAVYPNTDRTHGLTNQTNMKFASIWVCKDTKEVIHKSGYKSFPFHVPRWRNRAGEVYGRSPAHDCLPDIRVLNRMELTNLKAGQKAVDPPLLLPNDGFLLPFSTAPGAINYVESNEPGKAVYALRFEGNLPVGLEMAEQKRAFVKHCFMADLFILELKRAEMTATEVQDRREEQLRRLAPVLGKVTRELLSPMIHRTYELLRDQGRLPFPPPTLEGKTLSIEYESPATRAQKAIPALEMQRYLEGIIPLAQISPDIMDAIDTDQYAIELARMRGVNPKIIRPIEAIMEMRKARAQAEQMSQMASVAEPASKAIKNLADANEAGGAAMIPGL